MVSFFFIPATKIDKINQVESLGVDEIIIDFEDAVLEKDRLELFKNIQNIPDYANIWYRIPLRNNFTDEISFDFLSTFLKLGVRKIMIPKLISKMDYERVHKVIKEFTDIEIILLIEHPRLLIECNQILQDVELEKHIKAIGLGSHDLLTFIKSEHTPEQVAFPRVKCLYLAKAYNKVAIDIASMNIGSKKDFEEELLFGFEYGFDAKFFVHPQQMKWFESFHIVENKQLCWAKKIIEILPENYLSKEMEPFVLNNQIIEKAHIEKALAIIKKYRHEK